MENLKEVLEKHSLWLVGEFKGEQANLRGANLRGANLEGANLRGANLRSANLERALLPIYCKWSYAVIDGNIKIGCVTKSVDEWKKFLESGKVIETPRDTDEFRQITKVIKALIAYVEG